MSITIRKSPTADTRTCDFANVSERTLLNSSVQHIADVRRGLAFFGALLADATLQRKLQRAEAKA